MNHLKNRLRNPEPVSWKEANGRETLFFFDEKTCSAARAAMTAKRPLLLEGETGVGKSAFARACAESLKWCFRSVTVGEDTKPHELLWRDDPVRRLAVANVLGSNALGDLKVGGDVASRVQEGHFTEPGVLWWAFRPEEAAEQLAVSRAAAELGLNPKKVSPSFDGCRTHIGEECKSSPGTVVLIDEIDKGRRDVPNGLLEALGAGSFQRPGLDQPVTMDETRENLVVITTNKERPLPSAFIRRCLIGTMAFPSVDDLEKRVCGVFKSLDGEVVQEGINLLLKDRERAEQLRRPKPGQAELMDLMCVISELADPPDSKQAQWDLLEEIRGFTLGKSLQDQKPRTESEPEAERGGGAA